MNARADFQQQLDEELRQQEALQALMNITAKGCAKEAELLAYECGLGSIWKQRLEVRNAA